MIASISSCHSEFQRLKYFHFFRGFRTMAAMYAGALSVLFQYFKSLMRPAWRDSLMKSWWAYSSIAFSKWAHRKSIEGRTPSKVVARPSVAFVASWKAWRKSRMWPSVFYFSALSRSIDSSSSSLLTTIITTLIFLMTQSSISYQKFHLVLLSRCDM